MKQMNWQDGQHKAEQHVCSICGKPYSGFGNNAQPVNAGRCCDTCNTTHVMPARIARWSVETNPKKETK